MTSAPLFRKTFENRDSDRLGFAALLALAVHLMLLFGIGFSAISRPEAPASLAVTIAVNVADEAPDEADFLAQSHQQGGGQHAQPAELSNDREADFSDSRITEVRPIAEPVPLPPPAPQGVASAVVLADAGPRVQRLPPPGVDASASLPEAAAPAPPSAEVASLRAKLDHLRRDYSRTPKVLRVTSVNAKAAETAVYLDYWESLVEQVGNRHYPEEARRKHIFGSLRLAVTLLPDGRVDGVEVLESSGYRVLDQAAIRTIRLAAPFAPFADELAAWDRLEIIRTWQFTPGNRLYTSTD